MTIRSTTVKTARSATIAASAISLNAFEPTDANTYAGFRTPSKRPYMEASIGIENILKVFQVEVAWRLTYLDNPQATRFGIRFGTAFYF